ncbi:phospholipase D-like domain-containing protein [Terriglobus aquaticus]|uniref:phospholipase D n=1 Tax=Terriglobus aquaticus TaxID=940139 RepID=A0ABW9KL70_9BACT|nr:phospholipase D-like domain-containing protein [Terriglobus aquaticus]
MKLLIQPESGIEPLLEGLRSAKTSIHILIFRFDRSEVERALVEAVQRGVHVQALIAFTNRGEEKNLRKLEGRLLERGITVTRTADDLVRYHGKMFIIDRKELWLLAFNYTHMDITLSRSFALVVRTPEVVAEAVKLFEADANRQPYRPGCDDLVVSPANARTQLMEFIRGAKKQLLLYEMKISDHDFVQLLSEKSSQGVDVRVIGRSSVKGSVLNVRTLPFRLHARAILRDGKEAFLGSQSLRKLELEARREIGVIVHDSRTVHEMVQVFERDWQQSAPAMHGGIDTVLDVPARRVAKELAKHIHVAPVVEQVLERVMDRSSDVPFEPAEVAMTVRDAFREEVHDAVMNALREMASEVVGAPHPAGNVEEKGPEKAREDEGASRHRGEKRGHKSAKKHAGKH